MKSKDNEYNLKFSKETKKNIEKSLKEIKEGKFHTFEDIKKRLRLEKYSN